MLKTIDSRFASEYTLALSDYLAAQNEPGLHRANEIGILARARAIPLHDIIAVHTAAMLSSGAPASETQSRAAAEFLVRCCQSAETASAAEHEQFLRKVAHELRSPLTTLRLSLQVGLRKLEQGELVTSATLQKAISQVDKLSHLISELFRAAESARSVGQPSSRPPEGREPH